MTTNPPTDLSAWFLGAFAALGVGIVAFLKKKGRAVDQPSLLYALVPAPYFAIIGYLVHWFLGKNPSAIDFLLMQVAALMLGIAHVLLFYPRAGRAPILAWPVRDRAWDWKHFWFTLLLVLAGVSGLLVAQILPHGGNEPWRVVRYIPALLTFLVPFLWIKAFDAWAVIPVPVYRPWFPILDDLFIYEPDERLPKVNVRVVFEEGKAARIKEVPFDPNVRVERVYRWILHTYFAQEPDTYYREDTGRTFVWGWHFHRQKRGLRPGRRLDPMRTVHQTGLRAGDTLIVVRDTVLEPLEAVREEMLARTKAKENKP
ncbi:MAG: hypothetical protein IPO12_04745 [Flavobacteriales bacterium]|jgi:hypothetical protein|nr:hypothetical protein [Flavobacteriales bacterium]